MSRIVLVEDDPDVGEALTLLLEDEGHLVALVATGAAAITECRAELPDLVIVDVSLPGGMDGLDLTRTLKADEHSRALPVVLVSARAHEDDVAAGLAAGAEAYVVKPFRPDGLLSLVAATIAGRGQTDLHHRSDAQ